jgi:hypothetical protein
MTNKASDGYAKGPFGAISESDRIAALDIFGKFLMECRDSAISQCDGTLQGRGKYPPWERFKARHPDLDQRAIELIKEAFPQMMDTFMYCLLGGLDARAHTVKVSIESGNISVPNLARISWHLAGEPTAEDGWFVRFSKQRFELPI